MTESKTRKQRVTKEKSDVRLAADAYDKIRSLKQERQGVIDAAAKNHDAKIAAVKNELSAEAQVAFDKLG